MQFLKKLFGLEKTEIQEEPKKEKKVFSTDYVPDNRFKLAEQLSRHFKPVAKEHLAVLGTMDSNNQAALKPYANYTGISQSVLSWYTSQGFIGYQNAALLSQQWLISKACLMPAQDAMRKGYEITSNDGEEIDAEILDFIRQKDKEYKINKNLVELVQMGRVFGIRVAMFIVDSEDPDYYYKPFNIDGVEPYSYKGISQIDPYWITPQFDNAAVGEPASMGFYEPTWWQIQGRLVHKSHLIVYKTEELADILKPAYIYGGVPVPQKIYERVYAAERTANEAPALAMTKRTDVLKTDMAQALSNQAAFEQRMAQYVLNRDNYGIKTIDETEDMLRLDTSLNDLDNVIMTQYQIVAAAANVPSVKLLGTSPKGFNTTGSYEEASYHEFLETLQETAMTPLLDRHHELLIKSEVLPEFSQYFEICVKWNELDAMTAEEQAIVNKHKAENGAMLVASGAIDGMDERKRIINDPESGYNGLLDIDDDELQVIESEPSELNNE